MRKKKIKLKKGKKNGITPLKNSQYKPGAGGSPL
jgi:hypothetical protein